MEKSALLSEILPSDILDQLREIALGAGAITLRHFEAGVEVDHKADDSPVTIADREAEEYITEKLRALTPDIPVVGEEAVAAGTIPDISKGRFWLVDPLDGTKEFISGSGEFTVNIGLIENGVPTVGVVYTPVVKEMYAAAGPGTAVLSIDGGPDQPIATRDLPGAGITIIGSRRHGDPEKLEAFLAGRKVAEQLSRGSSLKFCAIAAGRADIYPRFGPTCEWDTAAGDAVLRAAGGRVVDTQGSPLRYGKTDVRFLNPEFIAISEQAAA